jgi:hypothetical protein
MKTATFVSVIATVALTLSLIGSAIRPASGQTTGASNATVSGQSSVDVKALNDNAIAAFGKAGGFSGSSKGVKNKVVEAEQLFKRALASAKAGGDACMEATVARNLAALYESVTYNGYLEETVGVRQSSVELNKKRDSVKDAWSDPRFSKCKKSVAKRISVYGPALDESEIDEFENFYQELRSAVRRKDKNATAALFDFPMSIRGKKKRTIRTKSEFLRLYDSIITPGVAKELASTSPAQLWGRDQGICVASGILWLNANMQKPNRFVITSVND